MRRINLDFTTKLAFGVTTVLVFFLSSAFVSLAHAGTLTGAAQAPEGTGKVIGEGEKDPLHMDFSMERFKQQQLKAQEMNQSYQDRWQDRKREQRLWEEYGAWLRDHNEPGSGNFGPHGYDPGFYKSHPWPMPTFVEIIMSII